MKFIVSRTSDYRANIKPCEEAKMESIVMVETRNFKSILEFDATFGDREGKWLSIGENHRFDKNGYIARDNGLIDVWTIEVNSLEELMDFVGKYGNVVVQKCYKNDRWYEIEIYDDYRE